MLTGFDPKVLDVVLNGPQGKRMFICEQEIAYFAAYYFPEYFQYAIPSFHWDLYDDLNCLMRGEITEALWAIYRESAKTSLAKIGVLQAIAYRKKRYINWDSYEKANAEAALFDITLQLQTNERLISDFGHLYYKKRERDAMREAQMKRVDKFLTENGVMVEAFSTGESTRGRVFKTFRPDHYVFDDIETTKTKDSPVLIEKIKAHVGEARTGLGPSGSILYLGNYITEDGVVDDVKKRLEKLDTARVRFIPLIQYGKITWPDKYVQTKKEAAILNKSIVDPFKHKMSIEERKEFFGKDFEPEMMNNPTSAEEYYFDRDRIRSDIKRLEEEGKEPIKTVAGFKIWHQYNPAHRYAGGADVAEGLELDSSASAIIDFTRSPALIAATYKDDQIKPDVLAHELKNQGDTFGECLWGIEINAMGYATVVEMQEIYPVAKIYRRERKDKATNQMTQEFGWRTTAKTKADAFSQFSSAYENGEAEIWDLDVLREMLHYKRSDLHLVNKAVGTRHFDLLTSVVIAWAMKEHATISKEGRKKYVQPAYQSPSLYGRSSDKERDWQGKQS